MIFYKSSNLMENPNVHYDLYDDGNIPQAPSIGGPTPPISNLETTKISPINGDLMTKKIMEYAKTAKPKLWVLTPCYGGMCHVSFVQSMMASVEIFQSFGIPIKFEFCKNDSLITRARNNLIAKAMTDPEMTHMIFIDNDITWKPVDLLLMMMGNKPIVGGIYPIKNYDWSRLVKDPMNPYNTNVVKQWLDCKNASSFGSYVTDEGMVQANMVKYNVNYLTTNLEIRDNVTKVRHIPTGFMMIRRDVIETMQQAFPDKKYVDDVNYLSPEESNHAYALFDCAVEEGHYFSEDWLFCERWLRLGGDIWADVSVNLTHTGTEDYRGSYMASLLTMT